MRDGKVSSRFWRVVVLLKNGTLAETMVRGDSGARAFTVGITVLLDRTGQADHDGAWCYFA